MGPSRRLRAGLVIAAAAGVLLVAAVVFMNGGIVPRPALTTAEISASPQITQQTTLVCGSSQLEMTGPWVDCATVLQAMSCPTGSLAATRVVHLHGRGNDFILYVEVDGGYRGPGTYELTPWQQSSLKAGDGVAKVAVRQWDNGVLWQSYTGSLQVDSSEESGRIDATLEASASDTVLHIFGPWHCP